MSSISLFAAAPVFTNDAVVLGLLIIVLALIFHTASLATRGWRKFYGIVPSLLLCYFVPALLNWPLGLIAPHWFDSGILDLIASRGVDIPNAAQLNYAELKVAAYLMPDVIGADAGELARGLSTIAGSWIGGGANQTAMKEIFEVKDDLFGTMIMVDVVVANIWMGFLLYGANISEKLDLKMGADNSAIKDLEQRVASYRERIAEIPTTTKLFVMLAVAFGGVALSHMGSDIISPFLSQFSDTLVRYNLTSLTSGFFWLVVIATTYGLVLSFTRARQLEGVGASRWGSIFIYVLVATIGMKMNLGEVFSNLGLFAIGIIWMLIHVSILLLVAKLIKAPFFFVAVGSAFSPSLAPVGVLMAVLGYALGTYGALICGQLMIAVAGG